MNLYTFPDVLARMPFLAEFDDESTDQEFAALVAQLRPRLRNVLGVTIGKGGQGKTTLAANVAYMLAEEQAARAANGKSAKPILYVELDANGNGRREFGLQDGEFDDDGARLLKALTTDGDFTVVRDVKPYLDSAISGAKLGDLSSRISRISMDHGSGAYLLLALLLAQISHHYRWIILDFSPGDKETQRSGMAAATHHIAPVMDSDNGTLDGLKTLALLLRKTRKLLNPEAEITAIAFLGFNKREEKQTAQLEIVRTKIEAQLVKANLDPALMLDGFVRKAEGLAALCRNQGRPAREMAMAASGELMDRKTGETVPRPRDERGRYVEKVHAIKLASDYNDVVRELITRVRARNNMLREREAQGAVA
ncbi:ParA family protein [Streptomyces anulatus]|uniref:ParA family protein n=1 Tax=Streptomyces anulatus TaxID=1892 RepID=UPI002F9153F2